ncbi:MAG: DNA polymerase/3'-5' exonuclease PolX, partial [Thermoplasmata archaeon]|nr:DNA polymerase/3'-5' exonuclease PolX [Thermoplasmata archaeon]
MRNSEVALVFYEIADLLELQGLPFKPQAYRRAASAIEQVEVDIEQMVDEGRHRDIPGVGVAIAKKIEELVRTGELDYLKKLRIETPPGLVEMLSIPDVGPRTAMLLHRELGIASVDELKEAALNHRLRGLRGFGEKTEERILQGIGVLESRGGRMLLGEALPVAEAYVEHLRSRLSIETISICGSLRRGRETIGDIDILVGSGDSEDVTSAFVDYPAVENVLLSGSTKSSVEIQGGLQVDLRVVELESYGAALQYFTGSKEHNVRVRRLGVEMGLKVNEYGVFERSSNRRVAGDSEHGVYESLGLTFIPPELREDSGEIDASRSLELPELVDASDVRGDLHVHSDWSDGSDPIEAIVAAAARLQYSFIAITDHTESLTIANGLTPERLGKQVDAIRRVQELHGDGIQVLAGTEVDIKADGSLDLPSSVLKDLDIVIGSVHSRMKMDSKEMTERVTNAMESGLVDIIGHPTGRIIGRRDPVKLDIQRIFDVARETDVAMEINAFPDRLDLRDAHCRLAK